MPPHRQTNSCDSTILMIFRDIIHNSVAVMGLATMEATVIQILLGERPLKNFVAYLSPSRPLIGEDLSACFYYGLSFLLTDDLKAKHVDWNSA